MGERRESEQTTRYSLSWVSLGPDSPHLLCRGLVLAAFPTLIPLIPQQAGGQGPHPLSTNGKCISKFTDLPKVTKLRRGQAGSQEDDSHSQENPSVPRKEAHCGHTQEVSVCLGPVG